MKNYPQDADASVQNKNKIGSEGDSAAAPFLQGLKVKAGRAVCYVSKDGEAISDILDMPSDFIYDALKSKRRDAPTSSHIEEGDPVEYDHREAMRILSLCACKTCSGTGERNDAEAGDMYYNTWECQDCDGQGWNRRAYFENFPRKSSLDPSPRVQALEEAAKIADNGNAGWLKKRDVTANKKEARDYETMAIACSHVAAAIRALSSQPVADGWLPIETAPNNKAILVHYDDGNIELIGADDNEYSWIAYTVKEEFCTKPTHWHPLPASPGASE